MNDLICFEMSTFFNECFEENFGFVKIVDFEIEHLKKSTDE